MERVSENEQNQYYLPHHAVIKSHSSTTKLRVVFDGSAKGTNQISLNESLLVGPTIQPDLFTILLQFRKYEIGISGDIEKMYRQILIHPEDRKYQCIVWRKGNQQEITTYHLNTVTYGTSAAPFLAIRTLHQISIDIKNSNPLIANMLKYSFYVDDFISSFPNIANAVDIKEQLCQTLSSAGFHLRKWSSNSRDLMETINIEDRESKLIKESFSDNSQTVKTLGLFWDTQTDVFRYSLSLPVNDIATKRSILSMISKVFDPLGWVAPVIVKMKIFMQRLWLSGIDWDSPLPDKLLADWHEFQQNLMNIKEIQVPRWLNYSDEDSVELHGFGDASEVAYGAAVYLRVVHDNGLISTRLVASKTRVAPVKQATLPRLELCAAQLTTKLLIKIKDALNMPNIGT